MKPLIIILILAFLFSCSSKKDKAIKEQNIETVNELNNDSIVANTPRIPPIKVLPRDYKRGPYGRSNVTRLIKHKEIPADGTYIYDIAYAEWQGKSMGEKVTIIIKGNTIKVIAVGKSSMGVKNGELIDKGMLVKHNKTGDWLITDNPLDANLEAYGGCVGAPMVIDFKNKKYWTC